MYIVSLLKHIYRIKQYLNGMAFSRRIIAIQRLFIICLHLFITACLFMISSSTMVGITLATHFFGSNVVPGMYSWMYQCFSFFPCVPVCKDSDGVDSCFAARLLIWWAWASLSGSNNELGKGHNVGRSQSSLSNLCSFYATTSAAASTAASAILAGHHAWLYNFLQFKNWSKIPWKSQEDLPFTFSYCFLFPLHLVGLQQTVKLHHSNSCALCLL